MTTALVSSRDKQLAIKDLLERAKPSIAAVIPKHLTPERLLKIALSATSRTPALLACTPQSILLAVMQAAELGLEAGGLLGDGYLVPYKGKAQFIVGYRGLINLARRSGQMRAIEAHVVRTADTFEVEFGLETKLVHRPSLHGDPGDIVAVYSVAHFRDGGYQVEVMTRAEVDAIRKRSEASDSGPWVTDYAEMAKKTVIRRLCKYLPLSPELAKALEHEAAIDQNAPSPIVDIDLVADEQPPAIDRGDSLAAKVAAKNGKAPKGETQASEPIRISSDGEIIEEVAS